MKIAVVTCYQQNDYIRARTLRAAFAACPGVETQVVRNRHKSFLRYPEVALRLIKVRLFDRPDAYAVTFRGYEILLLMRLTFVRKPVIFDELINFTEWMEEHRRLTDGSIAHRLFRRWNSWVVKRCRFILADTDAHAKHSATLNKLSIDQYKVIPTCADETIFRPAEKSSARSGGCTILYYGSMLPLHGLDYVLQAALLLKDQPKVRFYLIGGKPEVAKASDEAVAAGARIDYKAWVPFEQLSDIIHSAGLVLGGPFGDTSQSQFVVTGKTYQALACAAPVLVGKNQVHEGFVDKQNCLIAKQADPRALADAISWAYEHPEELHKIGQAGHELYEKHFSQKVVNKLAKKFVEEL